MKKIFIWAKVKIDTTGDACGSGCAFRVFGARSGYVGACCMLSDYAKVQARRTAKCLRAEREQRRRP